MLSSSYEDDIDNSYDSLFSIDWMPGSRTSREDPSPRMQEYIVQVFRQGLRKPVRKNHERQQPESTLGLIREQWQRL